MPRAGLSVAELGPEHRFCAHAYVSAAHGTALRELRGADEFLDSTGWPPSLRPVSRGLSWASKNPKATLTGMSAATAPRATSEASRAESLRENRLASGGHFRPLHPQRAVLPPDSQLASARTP